jgi:hypothetical protein
MLHAKIDVAGSVASFPKAMHRLCIHRRNRASLQTLRPLIVLSAKVGDKYIQGEVSMMSAILIWEMDQDVIA